MIDSEHPSLSIARQCQLVSISRSGFYYQPSGESELNLTLMRLIDEQHMRTPYYGARQMALSVTAKARGPAEPPPYVQHDRPWLVG